MKTSLLSAAILAGIGFYSLNGAAAAPAFTIHAATAAFTAAAPGAAMETFTAYVAPSLISSAETYDFGGFSVSKNYSVVNNNTGPTSGARGVWRGRPSTLLGDEFLFGDELSAWGANFRTSLGEEDDLGVVVSALVGGTWYQVGTIGVGVDPDDMFFAFTSDVPFAAVRVTAYSDRPRDTYMLDNMRYAAAPSDPTSIDAVPAPAGLALFGIGLLGLAIVRQQRRASV